MIARLCGAIVGLLVFAGMILAGLAVGNPFVTIVQRALVGLAGGVLVGSIGGYIAENIILQHVSDIIDAEAAVEAQELIEVEADMVVPEPGESEGESGESENKEDRQDSREYLNAAQERTLAARAAEVMMAEVTPPSTRAEL